MRNLISRRLFLVSPIFGFLGFKEESKLDPKVYPKLTEEERLRAFKSLRRYSLGLNRYGI